MRAYHFCNMYLAAIHAGIQSGHSQVEVAAAYLPPFDPNNYEPDGEMSTVDDHAAAMYLDWANNHKTMILLNAGMHGDLVKLRQFMLDDENRYPWASFSESEYALNGAMTNIALILPYQMYEMNYHITQFDKEPWPGFYEFKHDGVARTLVRFESGVVELRAGTDVLYKYTAFDLELIRRMSAMKLMG